MSGRITQLDGLRGLAALMVVIFHSLLVVPVYGERVRVGLSPSDGWTWWTRDTPLGALWNGGVAVLVFFVLSGFVLAVPFINASRDASWLEYYPRRLVRLYLPVWGAAVFALSMFVLFPRRDDPAQSWWVNRHDVPLALKPLLADVVLVRGTSWYNSPLWSLQYEVYFSLLLPIVLFVVTRLQRGWVLLVVVLTLTVHVGASLGNGFLKYMPIFALGVVLAVKRDSLHRAAERAASRHWIVLLILSIVLMNPRLLPFASSNLPLEALGATLLVIIFYGWGSARRLGNAGVVQWLGTRSFSLYLTHEPVIVSIAVATGWTNPIAVMAAALPLSLLVCAAFYRLVEAPSHRASRVAGRQMVARLEQRRRRSRDSSDKSRHASN